MVGTRWIVLIAAVSGAMAVGIGAMGAHGLPARLTAQGFDEPTVQKKLEQCEIGVRYQAYHAIAMLALGLSSWTQSHRLPRAACGMFLAGTLFFSGGLYSMVFLNRMGHWSIVPAGGSMLIVGWLLLVLASLLPKSLVEK
jgi:uncharacterized membrane protein YgdD (TMEM256/DUF423 family)